MLGTDAGQVTAILDFYATPENPQPVPGRYTMRGNFSPDGALVLRPDTWVMRPMGAMMVGFNGKVDILTIGFEGTVPECHRPFRISKINSGDAVAVQPAAPVGRPPQSGSQPTVGTPLTSPPPSFAAEPVVGNAFASESGLIALRADDAVRGSVDAPITIIVFADYQCPFSNRHMATLKQLEEAYAGKVRFVWKHLPLGFHNNARAAAEAAEAAREQGRFWAMTEKLFESQRSLDVATFERLATALGLDLPRFKAALASGRGRVRLDEDAKLAAKLGVAGTPATFVNCRFISGAQPLEKVRTVVEEELARVDALAKGGETAAYAKACAANLTPRAQGTSPSPSPKPAVSTPEPPMPAIAPTGLSNPTICKAVPLRKADLKVAPKKVPKYVQVSPKEAQRSYGSDFDQLRAKDTRLSTALKRMATEFPDSFASGGELKVVRLDNGREIVLSAGWTSFAEGNTPYFVAYDRAQALVAFVTDGRTTPEINGSTDVELCALLVGEVAKAIKNGNFYQLDGRSGEIQQNMGN
jgi:predicted DsbA family dithiol-disulfide isomerase